MSAKILFGFHAVTVRLKTAPQSVIEVHVDSTRRDQRMRAFVERAREAGAKIVDSDDDRLHKLCGTHRHQGVVARVEAVPMSHSLDDTLDAVEGDPLILVLDGLTDVRNFGAIARTCEVAGVDAIVIPSKGSVTVNADAVKTSAGALHSIPVCREQSLREAIIFLKNSGVKVVTATEKASAYYTESDLTLPVAIVMGAEDTGVAADHLRVSDELVRIPQFGTIQSLNVSVAAGVLIYEVIRQRGIS